MVSDASRSAIQSEERRGVAQSGSASALGAEGRGFESLRPDHGINNLHRFLFGLNPTNPHTCIHEKFCMSIELAVHHSLPVNVHSRGHISMTHHLLLDTHGSPDRIKPTAESVAAIPAPE